MTGQEEEPQHMKPTSSFAPDLQVQFALDELAKETKKTQELSQACIAQGGQPDASFVIGQIQMRVEMILEQIMPANLNPDAPDDAPADNVERIKFETDWQRQMSSLYSQILGNIAKAKLTQGVAGMGGVDMKRVQR